ncbi:GIY-YIG nuclease family protein [Paraburkholderia sp. SIMBA_055]|uniref:GIY-YIG nuclease family protein n=1 Tax=unclassified Paraburkholderia TaxID=2615204 RepID=UPI000D44139B|nr:MULTISPECIES: GIY-YIG nuclease family protein [unclassified Paraburkholderia]PTQ96486.1 hypothetical protein C8K19_110237 [Paraburkholderia sp. GV072]PUB00778.1 hypothetical protein C8K18_11439 [Paraburkholderia sp. GV068]
MNKLLEIGFQVAGNWYLAADRIRIDVRQQGTQRNVLYAFVCDGEVKYVGKSTQTLRERMAGYASPGSAIRTNLRVNKLIHALLTDEITVEVLVLPDNGLMHYGPFHLNLAAGLEDSIIRTLRPEWNVAFGRKRKRELGLPLASGDTPDADEALLGKEDPAGEEDAFVAPLEDGSPLTNADPVVGEFRFILQPTYRQKGFFNGGVASSSLLGAGGDTIEIFFAHERQPFTGIINRTSNSNGSPRLFGGPELARQFQTLPEGCTMQVHVYSPTSIRIFQTPR